MTRYKAPESKACLAASALLAALGVFCLFASYKATGFHSSLILVAIVDFGVAVTMFIAARQASR